MEEISARSNCQADYGNAMEAKEVEKVFGAYLSKMSEEKKEQWNIDGKVTFGIKLEEIDNHLHLLALQESNENARN